MKDKKSDNAKDSPSEKSGGETYQLSEFIISRGYKGTIDGRTFIIDFERNYNGGRVSQFASVTAPVSTPAGVVNKPIKPEVFHVSDLTPLQIHELANAQVITLNKAQKEAHRNWMKNRFPKSED